MPEVKPRGPESTPVTSQEVGNKRGKEEHAPMGSGSARGVKEEDILHKRYETFIVDNDWFQHVRGSLLGLEDGATPSKVDINTSEHFVPQAAASEPEPPEVVVDHWLPILQEQGYLMECHPNKFTAVEDWVPRGPRETSSGGSIHLC